MPLATPTIHDNGTSRERLAAGYTAVRDAIDTALTLLREAAPNWRDYPDEFSAAADQHRERDRKLREVHYELDLLAAHCDG